MKANCYYPCNLNEYETSIWLSGAFTTFGLCVAVFVVVALLWVTREK